MDWLLDTPTLRCRPPTSSHQRRCPYLHIRFGVRKRTLARGCLIRTLILKSDLLPPNSGPFLPLVFSANTHLLTQQLLSPIPVAVLPLPSHIRILFPTEILGSTNVSIHIPTSTHTAGILASRIQPPVPGLSQLVSCAASPITHNGPCRRRSTHLLCSFASWFLGVILGLSALGFIIAAIVYKKRQKKRKVRLLHYVLLL